LVSNAFPELEVTSSVRRVMEYNPAKHHHRAQPTPVEPQSVDDADLGGGGRPATAALHGTGKVCNLLNTSYPCDILDPMDKKSEWAETQNGDAFFVTNKTPEEEADFTADPEVLPSSSSLPPPPIPVCAVLRYTSPINKSSHHIIHHLWCIRRIFKSHVQYERHAERNKLFDGENKTHHNHDPFIIDPPPLPSPPPPPRIVVQQQV
jgi:hypothetical protein